MNYQRSQIHHLAKTLTGKRKFIQVVMGPIQVGKTTLVNQFVASYSFPYHFVSADGIASNDISWINQQWEIARLKWKNSETSENLLIIDEIQKVNNWSEQIKLEWDADSRKNIPIKVILLGSPRLLLQKGLTESLSGRFETMYLPHWSFVEMEKAFGWNIDQYAWFGGYPGSVELINDEIRWKKYISDALIETSISKDILMLSRVDKPALMRRLFELGCNYSGQILSYTKMLGQLLDVGNTTTLSHYLNLLDTVGLLGGIEKYFPGKLSQRSSSPKFQVHNHALISAQRSEQFKEVIKNPNQWGRIIESIIGSHLLNHSLVGNIKVFYWRQGNDEVDFIIEKENQVLAIEVKSGFKQKRTGLNMFKKKYPNSKSILVGSSGISCELFLQTHPDELF